MTRSLPCPRFAGKTIARCLRTFAPFGEGNNAAALVMLALLYQCGDGVDRDLVRAEQLLSSGQRIRVRLRQPGSALIQPFRNGAEAPRRLKPGPTRRLAVLGLR